MSTHASAALGTCLVTGGAGFFAGHLVRALLREGHAVRSLDLRPAPFAHPRLTHRRGDLRIPYDVRRACEGVETVFHVAAVVDFVGVARLGRRTRSEQLNVDGTRNVLRAARRAGARRVVYTSTNNVCLGPGVTDATGDTPRPSRYPDLYSRTKARAEAMVLAASGDGGPATCALRPGGIYGVGDPFYLPSFLRTIAKGLFVADVGDGRSLADNTFVGNLVHGHLLAARALDPGSALDGRAYYVTDGEPTPPLAFFAPLVHGLGLSMPRLRVPYRAAYAAGFAWEALHALGVAPEPELTRLHAMKAAVSHSGSVAEARRDFGYAPIFAWRDELDRCVPYCAEVLRRMRAGAWDPASAADIAASL